MRQPEPVKGTIEHLLLCWMALGQTDTHTHQLHLLGALLIEEAGGQVSTSDGCAWSVFDRSFVATNDLLHSQVSAAWFGVIPKVITHIHSHNCV